MSDESSRPSSQASGSSRAAAWEPPTPEELQKMLPKFEVTALLGRGGMGAVYKGIQKSLERAVAIKILSAELDEKEQGFSERFKNEARSMAKLNHPGIIGVHDFGQTPEGLLYIAMEFVAGTDVSRMLAKQGKLPPEHALAITAHICDALGYAHGKDIIHRDIKPANIMVSYDGVVKVADFGLAKMTKAPNTGLTQSGMAMGTLHYMAPEVLMLGGSADHRVDIYAVGVMLYQMLTGKLPQGMFDPPSKQIAGLDPRFDEIIKQAIRDDREVRYQSVLELRTALDAILTQPVARVEASETGEKEPPPAALPTRARPQRTSPQTAEQPHRSKRHVQRSKGGLSSLLWVGSGLLVLAGVLMVLFTRSETPKATTPAKAAAPAPPVATVAAKSAPKAPAEPPLWPTGPNYTRVGRFRAWSAIRNDSAVDLGLLRSVSDVKQVIVHEKGWIVLRNDGTTVANALGASGLRGIRRICRGFGGSLALIGNKGELQMFGVNRNDPTRTPPANLGPVKDAFISPQFHAVIQEDGKLVVWGKAFDGTKEQGNGEWKAKPALPAGRKAVALSATDLSLAVKLDDGSLLAWHIDRGALKMPPEFGPGKTTEFAVNRSFLLAVPKEGGLTLSWPLDDKKPVGRLPDNMRATRLIQTNRDMMILDAKGKPMVTGGFAKAEPAITDIISFVSKTNPEHISAHLNMGEPYNTRLIWYDESADAVDKSSVPLTAWPADGLFFRQAGRFKAWQSDPFSPLQIEQLERLKGVNDVRQVYQGNGLWVVLRENGDTIASERPQEMERKNITRICPGALGFYGLIHKDGSFESMVPDINNFPERKPPPNLKAQDAFLAPGGNYVLTPEGAVAAWGRVFDGINDPPQNPEWEDTPVVPKGRLAIAISHSEGLWGFQLENKTVKLWKPNGAVVLPPSIAIQPFQSIALTNNRMLALLDNGLPVSWKKDDLQFRAVTGLSAAKSVHEAGHLTAYFLTPEGRPHMQFEGLTDTRILDSVLPCIHGAKDGLISIRVHFDGKINKTFAKLLWFDGQSAPAKAVAVPSPKKAAAPVRSLDNLPAFVTRVSNYQKTRHARLSDLVGKYRNALSSARDEARKTGVLADVDELDAAIKRATALEEEIGKNRGSPIVKPLSTLPPLGAGVSQRLKDLRAIFDRELVKIEHSLVTALDQSLDAVQRDLVKAADLDIAKALEARRREILAAFPKPAGDTAAHSTIPADSGMSLYSS
ncbi:MAG: serine/threonine-protein kinase [Prosthecobacter sp.]